MIARRQTPAMDLGVVVSATYNDMPRYVRWSRRLFTYRKEGFGASRHVSQLHDMWDPSDVVFWQHEAEMSQTSPIRPRAAL
jgi:hypothetical protein